MMSMTTMERAGFREGYGAARRGETCEPDQGLARRLAKAGYLEEFLRGLTMGHAQCRMVMHRSALHHSRDQDEIERV